MSALRVLGFCYLATASVFALAIASADQARLHDVLDTAGRTVSAGVDRSLLQPVLDFARVVDEQFFDPPQAHIVVALDPPDPDARAFAHVAVPARRHTRL